MQRWTPFLHFNVHTSVFCILPFLFSCLLFTHSPPLHTLHTLRSSSPPGCAHSTQHAAHCTQQRISSSSSPGPLVVIPNPAFNQQGATSSSRPKGCPPHLTPLWRATCMHNTALELPPKPRTSCASSAGE
ncbi:hypothetical protein V8E51_013206 [Hyaloscypha variabilis]